MSTTISKEVKIVRLGNGRYVKDIIEDLAVLPTTTWDIFKAMDFDGKKELFDVIKADYDKDAKMICGHMAFKFKGKK